MMRRRTNNPNPRRCAAGLILALGVGVVFGCEAAPRNFAAISGYYEYDFTSARESLRAGAYARTDEQKVLNLVRLGAASLADGDRLEAERALAETFDFLSTAGLNEDRTTAAVLTHEGVRIWKGEPFEQALAYYYVAAAYAAQGDWENARAAIANALFRLRDFSVGEKGEAGAVVDTNFALGYLFQAIAADLSGASGGGALYDAALELDPGLEPIIGVLKTRSYDAIVLVDYGKGPTKLSFGPDNARTKWSPQDDADLPMNVFVDGVMQASVDPITDVNAMAIDHRWNHFESVRLAKSAIGEGLIVGGTVVAATADDSTEQALIGLGMMLIGALTKEGAKADTRYFEFAPAAIYLVPVTADSGAVLEVEVAGHSGARVVLPEVEPRGDRGFPRVIYVRVHGPDSPSPPWLVSDWLRYGNDASGVRPGDFPWILGGRDVSTPSASTLAAYQAGGRLLGWTVQDLFDLYAAEDILIGSGAETRPDRPKNPSYRHILEGGTGLFTPDPASLGYKRLMYADHPPYQPKSDRARAAAAAIGSSAPPSADPGPVQEGAP